MIFCVFKDSDAVIYYKKTLLNIYFVMTFVLDFVGITIGAMFSVVKYL